MSGQIEFAEIRWQDRRIEIEHYWVDRDRSDTPLIIFLHDGLGCVSTWRDFPTMLCRAAGCRGLVFSRYGYGRSSTREGDEAWAADFLSVQALELIPSFLAEVGVRESDTVWLFGHSDGGSIALIMAALRPIPIHGIVVAAPHTFIEFVTAKGVFNARVAFQDGELRQGLMKYHEDADSVMKGWSGSWLAPSARSWTIEPLLRDIRCPVLAIQGVLDDYGTLEQIRKIRRHAPRTRLLELPKCGHVPHLQKAEEVTRAASAFIKSCTFPVPADADPDWPFSNR